jgi:hypothetical protein
MDIERTTFDIRTWKNIYFSTYPPPTLIHLSLRFTGASKPATQKATSAPPFQPLRHQRNGCHVSPPTREPHHATNTSHSKQETFVYEYSFH